MINRIASNPVSRIAFSLGASVVIFTFGILCFSAAYTLVMHLAGR